MTNWFALAGTMIFVNFGKRYNRLVLLKHIIVVELYF